MDEEVIEGFVRVGVEAFFLFITNSFIYIYRAVYLLFISRNYPKKQRNLKSRKE